MSYRTRFKQEFDVQMDLLAKIGDRINWTDRHYYANWLSQTYYYVLHSTRLLALAAARFETSEQKIHSRFLEHLREEKGHEFLALKDLQHLGASITDYPELPETSAFYQTQYFEIEHHSPWSFFGYIFCLEGFAVHRGGTFFKTTQEAFGPSAAQFLKIHRAEDVEHLEKAFEIVDELPKFAQAFTSQNFIKSCKLYGHIMEACSLAVPLKSKTAS